jgi:hypothetical protein
MTRAGLRSYNGGMLGWSDNASPARSPRQHAAWWRDASCDHPRPLECMPRGARAVAVRVRLSLGLGALGWALACTPFEPGSDELNQSPNETVQEDLAPGRDWSCLVGDAEPQPLFVSADGAPRLIHSMQLLGISTGVALPGLRVRACALRDVDCASPLTEDIAVGLDGWVDVPVYEGFDGYMEVVGEAIIPSMLFYADRLHRGGQAEQEPHGLVEREALPGLSRAIGLAQSEDLGIVYGRAFDCQLDDARGVSYSIDRDGSAWYFVDGLPSAMVNETADSSLGGFLNVDAGVVALTAELRGVRQIGTAESVLVRGGWVTGLRFVPKRAPSLL